MTRTDSRRGRIVLIAAHCAGMVDMISLPVWVGSLIGHYRFDPQQAGGLATLFLLGAVAASLACASRFSRLPTRWLASLGFAIAAASFLALAQVRDFATMALLHAIAGVAVGTALSVTHGTVGRSANPHRLFAQLGIGLGVFALVFLGLVPGWVANTGGATLFQVFAAIMLLGAVLTALAFPPPDASRALPSHGPTRALPRAVWFAMIGVGLMGLIQAMTASFIERIGMDRGHGQSAVLGVLIAIGVVNLIPAVLAGLLQRRIGALPVVLAGPIAQAALALVITQSTSFAPYAVAASMLVAVMIFTHTFAFGLLAQLDPSGRSVAATPAMLMIGAAIGPVLGGTLVKFHGYPAVGLAAASMAMLAIACFSRLAGVGTADAKPA